MKNNQSALGLAVILWFVIIKSQNYFLLWARKQQQEPWSLDNYGVASPLHAIPAPMTKSCAMLIRIPKSEFLLNFNTTTGGISRVYWGYTPCITGDLLGVLQVLQVYFAIIQAHFTDLLKDSNTIKCMK